jgi:hypothetical protein
VPLRSLWQSCLYQPLNGHYFYSAPAIAASLSDRSAVKGTACVLCPPEYTLSTPRVNLPTAATAIKAAHAHPGSGGTVRARAYQAACLGGNALGKDSGHQEWPADWKTASSVQPDRGSQTSPRRIVYGAYSRCNGPGTGNRLPHRPGSQESSHVFCKRNGIAPNSRAWNISLLECSGPSVLAFEDYGHGRGRHIYCVSRFLAPACHLCHSDNDLATNAGRHSREYCLRRKRALTTGRAPHHPFPTGPVPSDGAIFCSVSVPNFVDNFPVEGTLNAWVPVRAPHLLCASGSRTRTLGGWGQRRASGWRARGGGASDRPPSYLAVPRPFR